MDRNIRARPVRPEVTGGGPPPPGTADRIGGRPVNDNNGGRLALSEAGSKGIGVFATRGFRRGDRILSFRGPLLPTETIDDFTRTIQVDAGLFLGASGGVDDFVNHSCDPNCGVRSDPPRLALVALRDIEADEEITFDYSTCLLDEPPLEGCGCGTGRCRGRIGPFPELPARARERYLRLGVVPEFVLDGGRARKRRI